MTLIVKHSRMPLWLVRQSHTDSHSVAAQQADINYELIGSQLIRQACDMTHAVEVLVRVMP
jgi:hypothetical protein